MLGFYKGFFGVYRGYIGYILGFYRGYVGSIWANRGLSRDSGKENGVLFSGFWGLGRISCGRSFLSGNFSKKTIRSR